MVVLKKDPMKLLVPLILVAWVLTAVAAIAATSLKAEREVMLNTQCRGDEPCYTHGAHCIDERTL